MEATLFYSNYCDLCSKIKEFKLFNSISKICIDNTIIRKKLPSYISQVPTILIKHHEELQLLSGDDAQKWFSMAEQSNIPIKPLNTNPDYSPQTQLNNELNNNDNNNDNNNNTDKPLGDMNNLKPVNDVLEGFSGGYSYIDNNSMLNNNNGNYSFLNVNEKNIETPQESQTSTTNKKNSFEKDYESMLLRRQKI